VNLTLYRLSSTDKETFTAYYNDDQGGYLQFSLPRNKNYAKQTKLAIWYAEAHADSRQTPKRYAVTSKKTKNKYQGRANPLLRKHHVR